MGSRGRGATHDHAGTGAGNVLGAVGEGRLENLLVGAGAIGPARAEIGPDLRSSALEANWAGSNHAAGARSTPIAGRTQATYPFARTHQDHELFGIYTSCSNSAGRWRTF